jgi:peptidoglycan/LPS O-acetylase OafA/YrhL
MAWCVVLCHVIAFAGLSDGLPAALVSTVLNGRRYVNVFIIVSGFVMTNLILARHEKYSMYLLRRALRIVPIYYMCLLVALILLPAQMSLLNLPWDAGRDAWQQGYSETRHHMFSHLILHLTLLHGIIPDNFLSMSEVSILAPAWSLSLEWQFYLIAPFLVRLLTIGYRSMLATVFLLMAGFAIFHSGKFGRWMLPSMLLLSIHFFLLGILCYIYLGRLTALPRWCVPLAGAIAFLVLPSLRLEVSLWTFFLCSIISEARNVEQGPIADPFGRFGYAAFQLITCNRIATWLGKFSYSTYLIHIPLFAAALAIGRIYFSVVTQRFTLGVLLISMTLLVPLSAFLYRFVEVPFIRLGSRLTLVKPIVPFGTIPDKH